jgi:phosphatidylinositol glycan class T
MLSDLQNHNLLLNSDGSWLIKRTIMLNPDSSLWMMVDFDEAYIPFQKFPADANRGIDAFPSRATFTIEADAPITLSSSSLLLLPPVPDMSMPFNVISLSCTLWAFVLGSLLNILVRRATESVKSDFTGVREKRPIDKLKEKMKDKIGRLKRVLSGKTSSKRQ